MVSEQLYYPLQGGYTPLYLAARRGHTTCVEHLLSIPGIDVNIGDNVSCYTDWMLKKVGARIKKATFNRGLLE